MRGDGRAWHGGRVLVCEDNVLMADVVCDFVRKCGLQPVGPVGPLQIAMRAAREHALDGAVLDIKLIGQPCFPVCDILLARHIPFMFLTAYGKDVLALLPARYRAARVISKPFEPGEMREAVSRMLGLDEPTLHP